MDFLGLGSRGQQGQEREKGEASHGRLLKRGQGLACEGRAGLGK